MTYNFNLPSTTFTADRFKNIMNFIKSYNTVKARLGDVSDDEIFRNMPGFSTQPELARRMKSTIVAQFGHMPTKEQEAKFLADYRAYTVNKYNAQKLKLENARKAHQESKRFTSPNGVNYTAKELLDAGTKAKKNARKSSIFRLLAILAGVSLGGFLAPLLLTSVFTGVMATSTLFSITAIGQIAGMVAGGVLGKKVYDAGGRKERLENNKMLAKFMAENQDALDLSELELENQQEVYNKLVDELGLEFNESTGLMEMSAISEFESAYPGYEAEGSDESEDEPIIADESEGEPVEREPESEGEHTEDPIELTPPEDEPVEKGPEGEDSRKGDKSVYTPPVIDAPSIEPDPDFYGPVEELPEPVEELPEPVEESPENSADIPVTDEEIAKKVRALKGLYSKAINQGICSPVGQYILVSQRAQVESMFEGCETQEDLIGTYEGKKATIKTLVNQYKKYKSKENGKNLPCLQELDKSEQGEFADKTELPDYIDVEVDGKTYFDALKRGYAKTNKKLLEGYLETVGADEKISADVKKKASTKFIKEMADEKDFGKIAEIIENTQNTMAGMQDEIADRVNEGGKLGENNDKQDENDGKGDETIVRALDEDELRKLQEMGNKPFKPLTDSERKLMEEVRKTKQNADADEHSM